MTTTPTSGAADLPEALTVAVDCWFAKNTGLGGCSDKDVRELADIFRIHALAAGQATAAQQGAAYAALPEYGINTASHAHFRVLGFTADQMRAFADATYALRASHGQAPAWATLPDGWVPLMLRREGQYPEEVAYGPPIMMDRLGRWLGKYFDQAAQADSVQEDAARYRFLRDGEWRDTDLEPFIRLQLNTLWDAKIDDARAAQEGGK